MSVISRFAPPSLQGYQRSWLSRDIIAGVTLAAVAIPETMGYTSIAQTPVVTGLYTVIFPTLVFALLGSSRLLVVGADSATAAILAAGLAGLGIAGLQPNSAEWLAWTSLVALVCGGLLVLAQAAKLGFLGDFLSASVLVGFLTGVGIQVFAGQIPDMLGIPKGTGNWFEQQWWTITHLGDANRVDGRLRRRRAGHHLGFQAIPPQGPRRRRRGDLVDHPVQHPRRVRRTVSRSSEPSRAGSRRSGCRRGSPGATSPRCSGSRSPASC